MSLDLLLLGGQVREMARTLAADGNPLVDRIAAARRLFQAESSDWEFWRDALDENAHDQAWLAAKPLEPILAVHDLPPCPPEYAVAASDGSQIDIDRHGIADCWVINIGRVTLRYGAQRSYWAESCPTLGFRENDLFLHDPRSGQEKAVSGDVLAAHRDLYEGLRLVDVALTLDPDIPRVALLDGTLIRWTLEKFEPWLKQRFLQEQLTYLETLRALPCPVASYLSRPRSAEVVGLARFLHVRGDWDRWKTDYPRRVDSPFYAVADHLVFDDLLQDGQRSARFQSTSRINVTEYPQPHTIQFFYLKVAREIARVEFPAWVAEGDLDLVHALIYDQCRRGPGYPVALERAHEQAVIHDGDRRQLQAVIERLFAAELVGGGRSAKSMSKLRPAL